MLLHVFPTSGRCASTQKKVVTGPHGLPSGVCGRKLGRLATEDTQEEKDLATNLQCHQPKGDFLCSNFEARLCNFGSLNNHKGIYMAPKQ